MFSSSSKNNSRPHKSLATAALIAGFAALTSSQPTVAQEAKIKIGSFVPPKAHEVRFGIVPWIKEVEKATGGEVKFQQFWGGSLSRSPLKQYEILENGIQDATIIVPAYVLAQFPDFSLFSLPYLGIKNGEEGSVALWRLGQSGMLRGLDRVHVVTLYTNDNSLIHFRKPIKSIEAVRGAKIRVAGPAESGIIKILGGTPVGMPITQTAQALNTGVVDGTMTTWGALQAFRLEPLAKSSIVDSLGVRSFIIAINKKIYDGLSAKAKAAMAAHGGEKFARNMGQVFDRQSAAVLKRAKEKRAGSIYEFSAMEGAKRAAMFKKMQDAWIEKTPDGAKKMATFKKILAEVRSGS